jgi:hypothetical protein
MACSLLLVSTLLSGCKLSSTTSSAAAQGTAAAAQSISATTQMPSANPAPRGKSVDVSWTAPTTNTNGSALTNLAGYRVYYGTSPSMLKQSVDVPNAGASDYVIQGLTQGTWYFAVTAYTNTGLQSSFSSVVSKTIT